MVAHRNYASFKSSLASVAAATAAAIETPKPSKARAPRKAKAALVSVSAAPAMEVPAFGRAIERASLVDALRRLTSVADPKSALPILSHVAIRASGECLALCATNLSVTLTVRLPAVGPDSAGMCIPARAMLDMVRLLPGASVNLRRDEQGAQIVSDNVRSRLVGIPDRDFPKIPDSSDVAMVSVDADMIVDMIKATLYAACKDVTRFHLNGALLESDENTARMVTTDGHRLVLAARPLGCGRIAGKIVPAKGLQEISKNLSSGTCDVGLTGTHLFVRQSGMELAVRFIDATFPPYDQVIPKGTNAYITTDRVQLLAAAKRAAMLTSSTRGVTLESDPDTHELILTCDHGDIGCMSERVELSALTGAVKTSVNPEYLVEALSHIEDDSVTLAFSKDPLAPLMVAPSSEATKPIAQAATLAVIMPMRV